MEELSKISSASGEEPPGSVLTLGLWLVCSSRVWRSPFQLGAVDRRFKSLKFGCHLGSEDNVVLFIPVRFKGNVS